MYHAVDRQIFDSDQTKVVDQPPRQLVSKVVPLEANPLVDVRDFLRALTRSDVPLATRASLRCALASAFSPSERIED